MKERHLGLWLLLIALIGWFAVLRGQIQSFSDNSLETAVRDKEMRSYQTRLDQVKQIKQNSAAFQQTIQALYVAMPRLGQIPEVLVMMENAGNAAGVVFSGVTVGSPTGNEVPVSVAFAGKLSDVTNFLSALNKNVRPISIKNQTITSDKSGNMSVTMQLGLAYQGK